LARDLQNRFAHLVRIGQVINSSLVLDEVLSRVLDSLVDVTGAERGAILLLDDRGDLVVRAARSLDHNTITADSFLTSRNLLREVARTGVPRLITDAGSDVTFGQFASVLLHHLQSIICVPLKVRDDVRGVLYVDHRVDVGAFTEDDLDLLDAFAGQASIAIENARMFQALAEQERQRKELEIARSIQMSLMPSHMPTPTGFALAAACVPAYQVGGDFYDALVADDGQITLFLGDVSGKGVPAALLMGMVRTLLRSEIERSSSLAETVSHCNRVLYDDFTNTNMFATLMLGRLDPAARTLTYVNCGHCESLLWRDASKEIETLSGDGLPLGILDEFDTTEYTVELGPGDIVVTYSDGYSEAKAPDGDRFGVPRISDALQESVNFAASSVLEHINQAVDRFAYPEPQSDDETMIVVQALR